MRNQRLFSTLPLVAGVLTAVAAVTCLTPTAAAHYHPKQGRWLQRDPLGTRPVVRVAGSTSRDPAFDPRDGGASQYADGMNLYQYARSAPVLLSDPYGMWASSIHNVKTQEWAEQVGYIPSCARTIAEADEAVDSYFSATSPMYYTGDFRYHFDTDENGFELMGGARLKVAKEEFDEASKILRGASGIAAVNKALRRIGRGLHPIQDIYSHSASHKAQVPFDHSPWEHCAYWNDPMGTKIDVCITARKSNPNWMNSGRPDDHTAWPEDVVSTMNETKKILRRWLARNAIDCICKE